MTKVIEVTSAEAAAARLLVKMAERRGESVPAATRAMANAVRRSAGQNPQVALAQEQHSLFPNTALDEYAGYRGPTACTVAGITYRQLDNWARTDLVVPTVRGVDGSGSQRLYSFEDIVILRVVKRLLDTGVSLQSSRVAVEHLRARGIDDLACVTLFSDGATVYECTSPEEVVDLLQGGLGVFGIAVGGTMREIAGSLAEFPAERVGGDRVVPVEPDELARVRQARTADAS